jgi:hypothetical protein
LFLKTIALPETNKLFRVALAILPLILSLTLEPAADAQSLRWKGFTWNITNGRIGGGVVTGRPDNVIVDAAGALHLKLRKVADQWTGGELFTQTSQGFGTYQWVLEGDNFYHMEPPVVLGLFTYGPVKKIGGDGENEIDTEFSNWNGTASNTRADFTSYPATGQRKGKESPEAAHENNFYIASPSTPTTTVRMTWSPTTIVWTIMGGTVPLGTTEHVLKTDTFSGTITSVPQTPCPVGMNLWSFQVAPTGPAEVVIQDFQFVAQ